MICILLVAGHGTVLEAQIKNDDTGLYSQLAGVPKALLPGTGGKKILDFWWETVNMCVTNPTSAVGAPCGSVTLGLLSGPSAGDSCSQKSIWSLMQTSEFHVPVQSSFCF
uniref:Uncharacterized protein n=1 Tax=Gasterosteus aculeatus TaxID=69293 RepID=G3NN77_GASAC